MRKILISVVAVVAVAAVKPNAPGARLDWKSTWERPKKVASTLEMDSFIHEPPLGFSVQSLGPPIPLI